MTKSNRSPFEPTIIFAGIGTLVVYLVSEDELNALERGSPSSLYLTFSLSLASIFVSFLVVLLTTPIQPDRTFYIFVILCSVTFISSFVLFVLWLKSNEENKFIIERIKQRLPEGKAATQTGRYLLEPSVDAHESDSHEKT
jgi:uncharacterized Tic20 family protein